MAIDQADQIDFRSINRTSGELWLAISDHLPWDNKEGDHLTALQNKLNTYLIFIESGEVFRKFPEALERKIVINLAGKFPMSKQAKIFFRMAEAKIEQAGFTLRFQLNPSN